MKRIMIVMMVLVTAGLLYGEELQINGDFKKVHKKMPEGWGQNKSDWAKPFGKVKVVPGDVKAGTHYLSITSTEQPTHVFYKKYFPIKTGDKATVTVKARGTGKVGLAFYIYGKNHYYMQTYYENKNLNDSAKEFTRNFTIEEGTHGEVKTVRVVVWADKNSSVVIEKVSAEIERK